jgi:hypothetical protein
LVKSVRSKSDIFSCLTGGGSGGGIERVFTTAGKQHDDFKMMKVHTGNGSTLRWVGGW